MKIYSSLSSLLLILVGQQYNRGIHQSLSHLATAVHTHRLLPFFLVVLSFVQWYKLFHEEEEEGGDGGGDGGGKEERATLYKMFLVWQIIFNRNSMEKPKTKKPSLSLSLSLSLG